MRRLFLSITALFFYFLIAAPVSVEAQNVQNFYFDNFHADYYLSKDEEGRSRLKVVEKITAVFPSFNQNKGIVRAIPRTYDDHPVSFSFESLTRNGLHEPVYDQRNKDGHVVISTGTEKYVHGRQTYELTYYLRDVTKDFGDYQEFFWDVNGTEWRQRFNSVSAKVHLSESIAGVFTGEVRCFEGRQNSLKPCAHHVQDENSASFATSHEPATMGLRSGETLSLVMKFEPNTFSAYTEGQAGAVRAGIAAVTIFIAVASAAYALKRRIVDGRDAPGKGVIIPQYTQPKNITLWMAASITGKTQKAMPAQIIDLAVRKKVRIIEEEKKTLLFNSKKYTLELVNASGLVGAEKQVVDILFGLKAKAGAKYDMSKPDYSKQRTMQALFRLAPKEVIKQGYRRKIQFSKFVYLWSLLALVGSFVLVANMTSGGIALDWRYASMAVGGISFLTVIISLAKKPLTDKGRELTDYLKGLEDYIKLAEKERIKVLQSPDGAEKIKIDINNKRQMVKLYEKLLPYAVMFGQEKQWAKVLEVYYEDANITAPAWYTGVGSFNASNFSSSIGSFTSSSSSSSGFSGGGAGGGGGGGGGGGR